eukprot:Ihof_evm2s392 gene=Ihof_evmTU2s392
MPVYTDLKTLRRSRLSLLNRLRSIEVDVQFVEEITQLLSPLPLVANLRCGAWYSNKFQDYAYFKSTDGHTGKWDLNLRRLNLHLLPLIAEHGGCVVVDSSRRKRIPDSFSKTVPVWAACINRAVARLRREQGLPISEHWENLCTLPSMVPTTEHLQMVARLPGLVDKLEASKADLHAAVAVLDKPIRPLWITPATRMFVDCMPDYTDLPFYPIICLVASEATFSDGMEQRAGYMYIQGAADDHEAWGMGLDHTLFWAHREEFATCSTESELEAVLKRVVKGKGPTHRKGLSAGGVVSVSTPYTQDIQSPLDPPLASNERVLPIPIKDTGLAVASLEAASNIFLSQSANGGHDSYWRIYTAVVELTDFPSLIVPPGMLHYRIPLVGNKRDFFCFESHLEPVLSFIQQQIANGGRVLLCCTHGTEASVALAVAVLTCRQSTSQPINKSIIMGALLDITQDVPL